MLDKDIIKSIKLWCSHGSHDKIYIIYIVCGPADNYDVVVDYGRRNTKLKRLYKKINVSFYEADHELKKLYSQKTNKGYNAQSSVDNTNDDAFMLALRIKKAKKDVFNLHITGNLSVNDRDKLNGILSSKDAESVVLAEAVINSKNIRMLSQV